MADASPMPQRDISMQMFSANMQLGCEPYRLEPTPSNPSSRHPAPMRRA